MVIDTSALLAIFLAESEREPFLDAITAAPVRLLSAANALETGIVLEARRGETLGREFDLFVYRATLQIVPVDAEQVEIARRAWRVFGKGRHPLLGRMYLPAYRSGTERVAELRRTLPPERVLPAIYGCSGLVDISTLDEVLKTGAA